MISTTKLGHGAISRLYLGEMDGKMVAVKKLSYVYWLMHTVMCFMRATLKFVPH